MNRLTTLTFKLTLMNDGYTTEEDRYCKKCAFLKDIGCRTFKCTAYNIYLKSTIKNQNNKNCFMIARCKNCIVDSILNNTRLFRYEKE